MPFRVCQRVRLALLSRINSDASDPIGRRRADQIFTLYAVEVDGFVPSVTRSFSSDDHGLGEVRFGLETYLGRCPGGLKEGVGACALERQLAEEAEDVRRRGRTTLNRRHRACPLKESSGDSIELEKVGFTCLKRVVQRLEIKKVDSTLLDHRSDLGIRRREDEPCFLADTPGEEESRDGGRVDHRAQLTVDDDVPKLPPFARQCETMSAHDIDHLHAIGEALIMQLGRHSACHREALSMPQHAIGEALIRQ